MQSNVTFLMFDGVAEAAMNLYVSLFEDSRVLDVTRYGPDAAGPEGTIEYATFVLNGQEYIAIDKAMRHDYILPTSVAVYVACRSNEEIERLYAKLSDGGEVQMALGAYEFSDKFGWVSDRFGVSWQLSLEPAAAE